MGLLQFNEMKQIKCKIDKRKNKKGGKIGKAEKFPILKNRNKDHDIDLFFFFGLLMVNRFMKIFVFLYF